MKPIDCLPPDRPRYFNGTFMLMDGKPAYVTCNGSGMYAQTERRGRKIKAPIGSLSPFYPAPRCVNFPSWKTAACVTRRPRRTMRRSSSIEHYEIVFSSRPLIVDQAVMWGLIEHTKYPTWKSALKMIEAGWGSVALDDSLILAKEWDDFGEESSLVLRWDGIRAGNVDDGVFIPDEEDYCYAKMVRRQLQEINPACL